MLGNDRLLIGWFRDAECLPPQWAMRKLNNRKVSLEGRRGLWTAEFVDTMTGRVFETRALQAEQRRLGIPLPAFEGAVALRLSPAPKPRPKP